MANKDTQVRDRVIYQVHGRFNAKVGEAYTTSAQLNIKDGTLYHIGENLPYIAVENLNDMHRHMHRNGEDDNDD